MTQSRYRYMVWGVLCLGLFLLRPDSSARAQSTSLPEDLVCRDCHSDSTRTYEFPSGETVQVGIDLEVLDSSPHSSAAVDPTSCRDCHTGQERYRFPHEPNPAETRHDFVAEVSDNCDSCHYPHLPFHPVGQESTEELEGQLPECADCHGSHDIAHVEQIPAAMTEKCLACHSDQSEEWVGEFLLPRPGLGEGQEGYAGSTRCNGCHDGLFNTWHETLHARLIQDVTENPFVVLGDFEVEGVELPFGPDDVAYTIGSRWRQAYLAEKPTDTTTQTVTSTLELLPLQWLVETEEWVPLEEGGEQPTDWITECGSCHVTGLNTETWGFTEFGVGCESCHGPSAGHAADPENVKPYAVADDQVCGSCHSRGTSPEGYNFPASYHPGDTLTDHFTLATEEDYFWPDGSAKSNHQQYMDWTSGNTMASSGDIGCTTCHLVHETGEVQAQLQQPTNDLCLECHNEQRALVKHTPFHEQALRQHSFTCANCHMPLIATTAVPFDLHTHAFAQPNPSASIEHGGVDMMPNSCNLCHQELAESPEWAQETIQFSRDLAPQTSFFGPGPTPTSPPPPTPMASVGEAPEEIEIEPPFGWLRSAVFIAGGLLVVVAIAGIANYMYRRRKLNA